MIGILREPEFFGARLTMDEAHKLLGEIFSAAGRSLANAVEKLGYPNGNRNAVIPENNLLVHVAKELIHRDFDLFCEAALSDEKEKLPPRRIDLIAARHDFAVAFEFKRRPRPDQVLTDLQRLHDFVVKPSCRVDGQTRSSYSTAAHALGVFVTTSYGVNEQTWLALSNRDDELSERWYPVRDFVIGHQAQVKRTDAFWKQDEHFARTGELRLAWLAFDK